MHELSIMPQVVQIVNRHAEKNHAKRILKVRIAAGELRELDEEWMNRYYIHFSKGTISEGAAVSLTKLPIELTCKDCGHVTSMERQAFLRENRADALTCGGCGGKNLALTSGNQFVISGIDIEF